MKQMIQNVAVVALLLLLCQCSSEKLSDDKRYLTSELPQGISVYGFNEQYDKPHGKYNLAFFLKNTTGETLEYPEVEGTLYLDGKVDGVVTGGPGKHLNNLDSGVVSLAAIMPNKVPDSIVFRIVK